MKTTQWRLVSVDIFRVFLSMMLIFGHGFPEVVAYMQTGELHMPAVLGLSVGMSFFLGVFLGEFLAAVAVAFGFMTRLASLLCITTMFVASFIFHWSHPFAKKELALLYLIGFLFVFFFGSGRISVNCWIRNRVKFHQLPKSLKFLLLG